VRTALYEPGKRRRLVAVVLSALALRALIPAGFMPMAGASGLSLDFCPGAGALPPGLHDHAHPAGGGAGGDPGRTPHHSPCLFSIGASTTFAVAATSIVLFVPALVTSIERSTSAVFSPAILRAQSSRGPPILL
jgi:hypothetical protein